MHILGVDLDIVDCGQPLNHLKSIEDQIDALVCAWVGILALDNCCFGLGDGDVMLWLPRGD